MELSTSSPFHRVVWRDEGCWST